MTGLWKEFLTGEEGQDLIEYTLLLAFIALASAALFVGAGQSVNGIWDRGSEVMKRANRAVTSRHDED